MTSDMHELLELNVGLLYVVKPTCSHSLKVNLQTGEMSGEDGPAVGRLPRASGQRGHVALSGGEHQAEDERLVRVQRVHA